MPRFHLLAHATAGSTVLFNAQCLSLVTSKFFISLVDTLVSLICYLMLCFDK